MEEAVACIGSRLPLTENLESIETGNATFWRAGWGANYPDPETFLNLLYGKNVPADLHTKSYMNAMRYKSEKFDVIDVCK